MLLPENALCRRSFLLEKGRATLGKDALFVIYNLYRRMPDPMFRVILSFL